MFGSTVRRQLLGSSTLEYLNKGVIVTCVQIKLCVLFLTNSHMEQMRKNWHKIILPALTLTVVTPLMLHVAEELGLLIAVLTSSSDTSCTPKKRWIMNRQKLCNRKVKVNFILTSIANKKMFISNGHFSSESKGFCLQMFYLPKFANFSSQLFSV